MTTAVHDLHALVDRLLYEFLHANKKLDNRKLTQLADSVFGGTRSEGRYTPRDAYDVLEIAVNKYLSTRAQELLGSESPLDELRALLSRLPTQADRTRDQHQYQQFSTPPTLAFVAARLLGSRTGETILEPSAGTGCLAIWGRALGARVVCNEIHDRRRRLLSGELGFETHDFDAALIDDLLPIEIVPTAILMNPPFSATGGRVKHHHAKYGLQHVESALRRLKDGGRLVAILGEGLSFERRTHNAWWQKIANVYHVRANCGVAGKEWMKFGTTFGVQLVVIDKTGPTPGQSWRERLEQIIWGTGSSLENAWKALRPLAPKLPLVTIEENQDKVKSGALFLPYVPRKLRGGQPHPAIIMESASMAGVSPPDITYHPHLPKEIVTAGKLSDIQMERIIYAGQRHEQRLPDGSRAGFFCGDGTGVGKGRVLAGIITDNWAQGRQRAVWFSVSKDLIEAARQDFADLGVRIPLARINDYAPVDEIRLKRGVIFSSYPSLISAAKSGATRFDQIQNWLGREGVIIFDEAHKAKHALASGRGEPTKTGKAVIDLQDPKRNPEFPVVYSSATGATEVRNMAYMVRLGLWGHGTSFPGGFPHFLNEIEKGGVGAMEMVSRDMKGSGMYLSGSISFGACPRTGKAVEYRERIHLLTPEQRKMYGRAAAAWQHVLQRIEQAIEVTNGGKYARANALNKFWGDHQRFFRQLINAFKVGAVISETEAALRDGKSVVISLISTAEARTEEQVAKSVGEGGSLEDLDFSPREILANLIHRGFPTEIYEDQTDPATQNTIKVLARDKKGNVVESRPALQLKKQLLDGLSALHLPENPLDQLVNHFGPENVSELTGRARRLIRDPSTGRVEYRKRAPEGVSMDRVNLYGAQQFQSGKTRIAIISDAASMGISLHASNRAQNQQRRVHITLELGWSADKQMQVFGRTHRSDQAVPPEFVLVTTELGGEKRFCSTIARRLGSLGALTKGDRGAADNADWARYNFETQEGKAALKAVFASILQGLEVPGLKNPKQALRDIGLLTTRAGGREEVAKKDQTDVPRFLNRVLALNVEDQNALVDYFIEIFAQTVRHAKANGTFDEGVTDIQASAVRRAREPEIVHIDAVTGAQTKLYTLDVALPMSKVTIEEADWMRRTFGGEFLESRSAGNFVLALPSGRHTNPETGKTYGSFSITRPEGRRMQYLDEDALERTYKATKTARVRPWWQKRYAEIPDRFTEREHFIVGAIIPLWQRLKVHEARLRVVRVTTDDGERIVGVQIPASHVARVLRSIGLGQELSNPEEIFRGVLEAGETVDLVADLQLRHTKLHGSPAIELVCHDPNKFDELRGLKLINEQIQWKQRFFVPSSRQEGLATLAKLLDRYPVMRNDQSPIHGPTAAETTPFGCAALETKIIDLDEWIIPFDAVEGGIAIDHEEAQWEMQPISDPLPPVDYVPVKGLKPLSEFPASAFVSRKRSPLRLLDPNQMGLFGVPSTGS